MQEQVVGAANPALESWFRRLAGRWHLSRGGSDGSHFEGIASFTWLDADAYMLEEAGRMRLAGGESLPAGRFWVWRLTGADTLEIRYPPDRGDILYHRLALRAADAGWRGNAVHPCAEDLYDGAYRFEEDRMVIRHIVTGPAKHYRLEAVYDRLQGGDSGLRARTGVDHG